MIIEFVRPNSTSCEADSPSTITPSGRVDSSTVEGVGVLLGHVQPPAAVGARDRLGLESVALDRDDDVGHRLVVERDDAGEVEVGRLLVAARLVRRGRREGAGRRGEQQQRGRQERTAMTDQPARRALRGFSRRTHRTSSRHDADTEARVASAVMNDGTSVMCRFCFAYNNPLRPDRIGCCDAGTGIRSRCLARGMNSQRPTLRIEYGAFARTGRRRPPRAARRGAQENPWSTTTPSASSD